MIRDGVGSWADGRIPEVLLSDGLKGGAQPLVLPGLDEEPAGNGKGQDGPQVLPGLADDEPLILPDVDDAAPLFANPEARLALTGGWMLTLDGQSRLDGVPAARHDDWI